MKRQPWKNDASGAMGGNHSANGEEECGMRREARPSVILCRTFTVKQRKSSTITQVDSHVMEGLSLHRLGDGNGGTSIKWKVQNENYRVGSGSIRAGGRLFSLDNQGPFSPRQRDGKKKNCAKIRRLRHFKREKKEIVGIQAAKLLIRRQG